MSFSGLVDDINAMLDTVTVEPQSTGDDCIYEVPSVIRPLNKYIPNRLVDDIMEMMLREEPTTSGSCCIYKVPSDIRTLNEDAYTPKFLSIGPFHHRHSHPQYQNMERRKLMYFKAFLQRTKACLNTLTIYIDSIFDEFKISYSETLPFSQNGLDLVKIILIDSGFIIELFWRFFHNDFLKPWLDVGTRSDLLLLENQLPFFVIENIYRLSLLSSTNVSVPNTNFPSFLELTIDYFQYHNKSNLSVSYLNDIQILHFTDLIRIFHLQHSPSWLSRRKIDIMLGKPVLPSATELFETGVKFKVNTKSECLLDLRFSGRDLEIPQLKVDDGTETLFRNMVVLEQCHYPDESYIIDYVAALDCLIKTGADADILVQSKILQNFLGDSDSVANLFKSLCKNITHDNFSSEFSNLCIELNTFCRNPLHKLKLKATFMRDYCNTPWQAAASFAGILLLVLTLIQTVCSILQVLQAS